MSPTITAFDVFMIALTGNLLGQALVGTALFAVREVVRDRHRRWKEAQEHDAS